MTDCVIQVYYYPYWFSMYLFLKITEISNSNCVFVCFSCSYTSFCFMEFEAVNCIKEQSWRPYTTWFQDLLSYSNKTGWYWYRNRSKKKTMQKYINIYMLNRFSTKVSRISFWKCNLFKMMLEQLYSTCKKVKQPSQHMKQITHQNILRAKTIKLLDDNKRKS